MKSFHFLSTGQGARKRQSYIPPVTGPKLVTQRKSSPIPSYPFQPLPTPNGPAPYRYDLAQLLSADDINQIKNAGVMVFHSVGDTGDYRGQQQEFVSTMMAQDVQNQPANAQPAFFYHLGDVVYFAGDIVKYPDNFYTTYKDYPCFIVSIPGNHDCQPDDPNDGPGDPNKTPLDGWIQNFMSKDPTQPGSLKTGTARTQLDLPNVYWTFTTPFATILGLFSNVGETEGEIHQDQIDWFQGELKAADPNKALIVTVHHPPFSGDAEHSGSSAVYNVLLNAFQATKRYPDMILSGHVHNYQRFTHSVQGPNGTLEIPCIVAGAGGYTKLGALQSVNGAPPQAPLNLGADLTLEQYDDTDYGFLRLAVSKTQIVGTYLSAPYSAGGTPSANVVETFTVDLTNHTVTTGKGKAGGGSSSSGGKGGKGGGSKKPKPPKNPSPPKKKKKRG